MSLDVYIYLSKSTDGNYDYEGFVGYYETMTAHGTASLLTIFGDFRLVAESSIDRDCAPPHRSPFLFGQFEVAVSSKET